MLCQKDLKKGTQALLGEAAHSWAMYMRKSTPEASPVLLDSGQLQVDWTGQLVLWRLGAVKGVVPGQLTPEGLDRARLGELQTCWGGENKDGPVEGVLQLFWWWRVYLQQEVQRLLGCPTCKLLPRRQGCRVQPGWPAPNFAPELVPEQVICRLGRLSEAQHEVVLLILLIFCILHAGYVVWEVGFTRVDCQIEAAG